MQVSRIKWQTVAKRMLFYIFAGWIISPIVAGALSFTPYLSFAN